MRWAYALRDAVALADVDVVVSHVDDRLEADALAAAIAAVEGDWVDRVLAAPPLAQLAPVSAGVELVQTLAGLYRPSPPAPPIAATMTGPATVAAYLAAQLLGDDPAEDDLVELADLAADALAGLIGAYAEAGAQRVAITEPDPGALAPEDVTGAHRPLVRALAHHRVDGELRLVDIPGDIEMEELRAACAA
jgi:uroporphyrinogen-III decarboxylase